MIEPPKALVPDPSERAELVERYERAAWLRAVAWGIGPPAVITLILLIPGHRILVPGTSGRTVVLLVLVALPYGALCIWHARFVLRRLSAGVDVGLAGEIPIDELRRHVAALPFETARWASLYWIGLPLWLAPWVVALSAWHVDMVLSLLLVVLANTLEGALLVYLGVERALRDLKALVMKGAGEPSTRRLAVSGRFLLAFATSTAVPLLILGSIVLIAVWNDVLSLLPPYIATFLILVIGLGFASIALTARSVGRPLDALRQAADRVAEGELDAEVDLDDSGEIGSLQLGFNRMVAGLRDRERIRDLFGRHVGGDVVEKALAAEPNLEGEIRCVTAMFIDVIGSTPLAQSTPPMEVVAKLNSFFDAVVRNVALEGGTVNQFQGDGAVCIFGAPLDQPDHAERALRCAARLASDLARIDGVSAAIGVSTGDAVAGNIGTLDRYGYTVIGDPVNEASRLCDAAKDSPGRVLVADSTFAAAGSPVGWSEAGTFTLKGRAAATLTHTLSA